MITRQIMHCMTVHYMLKGKCEQIVIHNKKVKAMFIDKNDLQN